MPQRLENATGDRSLRKFSGILLRRLKPGNLSSIRSGRTVQSTGDQQIRLAQVPPCRTPSCEEQSGPLPAYGRF